MTVSPGGAIPRGILTGADSPPRPLAAAPCPKIVLLLFGEEGGKRSRETGAQVKGRDPCACAQESLPGKMKARPNGRAELSVMVCVIKTSQGDSG